MTANKHTPAPWAVVMNYGDLTVRSANARDTQDATYLEIVERVGGLRTGPNFDRSEEEANARLISAAPEYFDGTADLIAYEAAVEAGDDVQAMLLYASAVKKLRAAHLKAAGGAA